MTTADPKAPSPYIVSARYDWLMFLGSPLAALLLGMTLSDTPVDTTVIQFFGQEFTLVSLLIGAFIHAHLVIVFYRSHGNAQIRELHRFRFFAVPLLLYVAMLSSSWVLISVSVLATFWDVYHSALQTFGFSRLYDRKAGNESAESRSLDWWLNQLLYCGPILAGASMIDHFEDFEEFEDVGSVFFTSIPAFMETNQRYFTWAVIAVGTAFLLYYVWANWEMHRRGEPVSKQKVFLLASTGFVSIYTWGFNTWGMAFFIMNLFHALQYFGLVWYSEQRNMSRLFRLDRSPLAKPLTLMLFVGSAAGYGMFVQASSAEIHTLWAITLVVSIMHFWYDGFIWSVRKRQV